MPINIALKSTEVAIITFDNESHLARFIQTNHQRLLPTGRTLLVAPIKPSDAENAKREEKRQLRKTKKAEWVKDEFENFGDLFSLNTEVCCTDPSDWDQT